jgi:DNA polymerase delta subunit 1
VKKIVFFHRHKFHFFFRKFQHHHHFAEMAFSGGGSGAFVFSTNAAWDEQDLDAIVRGTGADYGDSEEFAEGSWEDEDEYDHHTERTHVEKERLEYDEKYYGEFYGKTAHATWRELQMDPSDGGMEDFIWPTDWHRPNVSPLVRDAPLMGKTDFNLAFQMTDIDYSMVDYGKETDEVASTTLHPEIRIYGTTGDGNSICARVRNFYPYFYTRIDPSISPSPQFSAEKEEEVTLRAIIRMERYLQMSPAQQEFYRVAAMHTIPSLYVLYILRNVVSACKNTLELECDFSYDDIASGWASNFKEMNDDLSHLIALLEIRDSGNKFRTNYTPFLPNKGNERDEELLNSLICCPHCRFLHQQDDPYITQATPISYLKEVLWTQQGIPLPPTPVDTHAFIERRGCECLSANSRNTTGNAKRVQRFYSFVDKRPAVWNTPKLPTRVEIEWVMIRCLACRELFILTEGFLEVIRVIMDNLLHNKELGADEENTERFEKAIDRSIASFRALVGYVRSEVHEPILKFTKLCDKDEKCGDGPDGEHLPDTQYVRDVRVESDHRSVYGGEETETSFLRIELYSPRNCTALRTAIQFCGLLLNLTSGTSWLETYESNILFTLRYMVDADIVGMGWITLSANRFRVVPSISKNRVSKCQIEVLIPNWADGAICGKVAERDGDEWGMMAKLRSLWVDIEVAGQERTFPIPSQRGAVVSNIGISVFEEGVSEPVESCVLCLGGAEPMLRKITPQDELTDADRSLYTGTRVYTFGTEQDLLLAFRRMMEIVDPDYVGGYNIKDFDFPFMVERSMNHALGERLSAAFRKLGRLIEEYVPEEKTLGTGKVHGGYWRGLSNVREEVFSSRGTGTRRNKNVPMSGRISFDALTMVKANHKLRSYKLDNVAGEFLGLRKREISYHEVTQHAIGYYDIHRTRVNDYVKTDDILPKLIAIDNKTYHLTYTEQARVCGIPMSFLLSKGQTIKILAKLLRHDKRLRDQMRSGSGDDDDDDVRSHLIPYRKRCMSEVNPNSLDLHTQKARDKQPTSSGPYEQRESSATKRKAAYEGATVIEPKRGFYNDPVPTLDFAALYPSIILAWNLCYTTHIRGKSKEQLIAEGYACAWDYRLAEEGGNYRIPVGETEREGSFIVTPSGQCFWKSSVKKGLLPEILKEVLAARKGQKRKMRQYEDGTMEQARHNAAQLALKLVANSLYGFTGCDAGLKDLGISESVTAFGRYLLEYTRDYVRELGEQDPKYANDCLYGDTDSVMVRLQTVPRVVVRKVGNWDGYEKFPLGTPIPPQDEWEEGEEWMEMVDMWEAAERGKWLADGATALFKSHGHWSIILEFEKVYQVFLLQNKKKYSVKKWEEDQKTGKLKPKKSSSGLENVRRDQFLYTKTTINGIIDRMIDKGDINAAFQYAYEQMVQLINGEVPTDQLVLTSNFSKRPDLYATPNVAVECAKRAMRRDPGTAPTVGSRIPYIMVMRTNDKAKERKIKAFEKSEDPEYAKEAKLSIDYDWYAKRFMGPLCRFFAPAVAPNMEQKDAEAYTEYAIFRKRLDYLAEQHSRRNSTLIKMFKRKQTELDGAMNVEEMVTTTTTTSESVIPSMGDWIFTPSLYSFDTIYTGSSDPKQALADLEVEIVLISASEKKRISEVRKRKAGDGTVPAGHRPIPPSSMGKKKKTKTQKTSMVSFFAE